MTDKLNSLIELIGEDNADRLRDRLTELIIKNLEESINTYYLLRPETIDESFQSFFDRCEKEVIKERKDDMTRAIKEQLNHYVDNLIKHMSEL